ncbi:MAG: hypothetical protein ACHQQQ_04180 [Bacteroidota bacterium]
MNKIKFMPPPIPAMVGDKQNYNLQHGVTQYELYPFSTIEWVDAQSKYRARAMVQDKNTGDDVIFNSWHTDFADAERAIAIVADSFTATSGRYLYNIWGEIIEIHTADHGGGHVVSVTEVQTLLWSMDQI